MDALREPLLSETPSKGPAQRSAGTYGRDSCLFLWVRPLLDRGRLALSDLALEDTDVAQADQRLQARLQARPQDSLLRSLAFVFAGPMLRAALCKLIADLLKYIPPLLLSQLLVSLREHQSPPDEATDATVTTLYLYAIALALPGVTLLQA